MKYGKLFFLYEHICPICSYQLTGSLDFIWDHAIVAHKIPRDDMFHYPQITKKLDGIAIEFVYLYSPFQQWWSITRRL